MKWIEELPSCSSRQWLGRTQTPTSLLSFGFVAFAALSSPVASGEYQRPAWSSEPCCENSRLQSSTEFLRRQRTEQLRGREATEQRWFHEDQRQHWMNQDAADGSQSPPRNQYQKETTSD